ncbi:AAA family ATPase, partial [Pirellulales bacterium]|nr:AAA family ATPase [Pirellulales bacterium]
HSTELVRLNDVEGDRFWTTREMLETEARMIRSGERLSKKSNHTVGYDAVARALERFPTLRDEQKRAVRYVTTGGDLVSIHGVAGAGKNFLMQVAVHAWQEKGLRVIGTALAAKAAKQLTDLGIESHHLHQLFRMIEAGEIKLESNTLLLLDESSMVGTKMMERCIRMVEKAGAKITLCGDATQLSAIDAGAPARMLAERTTVCELREIIRQRDPGHRDLVHDVRAGRSGKALQTLLEKNLLFVGEDKEESFTRLICDWKRRAVDARELEGSLIIAGTNDDVAMLNRAAQEVRRLAGDLGEVAVKVGEYELRVGDRVAAKRNRRALLINNGMTGTVTGVSPDGVVRVRFDEGLELQIDTDSYLHLVLAYSSTVHASQGQTSEFCFMAIDQAMTDREAAYVGVSRPRGEVRVYGDILSGGEDMEELARILERSRAKENAHDFLPEQSLEIG